ncbi:MAG: DUF4417 domain-containing protein [Bacteroidales bacterium]|nr:DUF4417 domain-containing protein [Bacteroidales bacterium]
MKKVDTSGISGLKYICPKLLHKGDNMTRDALNLGLLPSVNYLNDAELPQVRTDTVDPMVVSYTEDLIPFNRAKTCRRRDVGVHFFIDDYQFERVWRSPQLYVEQLRKYHFVCAPDFSLYLDVPAAVKIWNVYRSRLLTAYWQRKGLKVIPTLQWADPKTFGFCFVGIQPGGTVAVSTLGAAKHHLSRQIWIAGMKEAIKQLHPDTIILYGTPIYFDFGNIDVMYYKNEVLERRSGYGR